VQVKEQLRLLPSDDLQYDIGISVLENGLLPEPKLLEFTLVPVAHKDHPIFANPGKVYNSEELQQFKQDFCFSMLLNKFSIS
jgi:DNA-binding transcriptional LysR family regulator